MSFYDAKLLIDGTLRDAADGARYDNVNPATGQVIGQAPDASLADIDEAIAAARRAFDDTDWSTNVELRVRCLRQLQAAFETNADVVREMTVAEVGCPVGLTYAAQLDVPVTAIGYNADVLEGYRWDTDLGDARPLGIKTHRTITREPIGVVAAITPWNFPHQINLAKVIPALAAGCTVVLKAAPATPWAATNLARLVAEHTDFPAGVINVITSQENAIGEVLCTDPRVDMVSFTGSTATGRKVMAAAAETLKKTFLELGGKSAFVVLDDADAGMAAMNVAFQIMAHAGQGCAITTRLLVPRARHDEIVDAVIAMIAGIGWGDPTDPGNFMGPIISEAQRDRVLGYINDAIDDGAILALGSGKPAVLDGDLAGGFFVEPTILVNVDQNSRVAQEEIFGPVLAVIAHDGDDDAVAIANNSIFGLSGAVVSADVERARAVARRIRTGTISVNGGLFYSPDVPFGGYKQSGIGREMGIAGFEEYLEIKAIAEGI
ncbi:MAG: aldehyde dehydrogenase family protein [Actinobacteria bacterium]|nr:aldehyde dehydrogenase family protein [Actinomycetota bacterium]